MDDDDNSPGFPPYGVLTAALDGVVVIDAQGRVRDWNPAAERLFGYERREVIGREMAELIIPPPLRDAHRTGLRRYVETNEQRMVGRRVELSAMRADGSEFAIELTITLIPGTEPPMFAGFVRDLGAFTARTQESARVQNRMTFLAQAGLVLDRSLDYAETLRALADLTVPGLAQLTVIDLLDERGQFQMAVAASEDQQHAADVEEVRRLRRLDLSGSHPVAIVLRSDDPMLLPEMSGEFLRQIAQGAEHFELMRRLRYHSAIVVPLIARARTLGALSLLRMQGAPSYDENDLALAQELARRAALAVDNARLFESTRDLARTLQQSLIPHAMPEIPGVRVTGRYRAAERGHEVGGDFYDAFSVAENRWGITIGDVCGKGAEAAALTARARYTIRAFADRRPATVLRYLNEAVIREGQDRFLTAIYGAGSIQDGGLRIELAIGGHPIPLILREDGRVDQLGVSGPLIGLVADAEYPSTRFSLGRGDAMVLYTDGLTDAQAPHRILSDADLVELLSGMRGLHGDELAALIEERATEGGAVRDDIALLVVEHATG